ncbi:hypothetical protein TRFO_24541 [Tritrichomonas foetus]|uniref:Transmembrane protein n=1 Tax=Tritrichomonas foetus TaxID=1144522 RepID=A0A1J4K8Z2_9EUKA|nr:hypothetical protein TRFO_24541 [Tritrichomonas foetus]|eukprot:OHT07352.1 hypothetical protein TRFO_24541 [Tritrichomonas foetus]
MKGENGFRKDSVHFLSSVFSPLPDVKPERLSEYDFCLFNLMISICRNPLVTSIADNFFSTVYLIQIFSTICIPQILSSFFQETDNIFCQIFRFFLNFTTSIEYENPVYLYTVDIFYSISIGCFIYGLYLIHRRMSIPASLQIIFYFTIISFPPILIFASTQHIAYLFFSILADGVIDSLSLSVISIILYILIFFIRCEFLVTAFGSFFYRSGNFITFSVYTIDIVFLSCACVLNGSYITLGEFKAQFTLSLFYFLAGFFYFFTGGYFFAMTNVMNALTQAYGISLLVSSILSFIDLYGQFPNNELSYIIIFWVAIISYCFFKLRQDSKDRRNTLILKNCHNFDDLPIRNSVELVSFFKAGLMTPLPFIYDGSFFIWGFLKYKNSWILMEIVRLSSLIPRCEKLDEIINDYFGAFTNENQNDRFILYEHYLIMGMRFYEAPETLMPKIKTAFKQIDQFRFISKNFSCSFSKDPPKVFLFSEGLAQISSRLYSYVKNMNQMYPNCPDVLRLMSQYYKKVENDSINYTLLNNQALSIERGYFGATDFHFVKIASAFPVAQRILYESMQKDAIQKAMAEEPSQQVHNSYISNKSNTLFIVTVTLFILFSISVLIDFFFNVGLITTHTKGIYTGYNMIYEYSKCSIIFSNFFYKSIEYLQSSLDEEYTIVDNLFSVFDDEILSLYEMFMFNTKNPLFQEHFMWFDENTYPITSLNMQKINAGFRSGLGRVSDIFTKLFDPKYQSSQDDIVFYYISSFDLLEGFFQIIDTFPFSFQKLCDQTQERDMQHLLYSMIPLIVFVLLFSAIPFFY